MIPIPSIIYIQFISFVSRQPRTEKYPPVQGMTITFTNDSDIIVYALKKMIHWARDNQYLFVANCAWWIARVIGLDSGLIMHLDNLEAGKYNSQHRVSKTPRDIARPVSVNSDPKNLEELLLRTTDKRPFVSITRSTRLHPEGGIRKLSKNQRRKLANAKRAKDSS